MKKFYIYFLIILSLNLSLINSAYSTGKIQTAEISKIENNIYGFDYTNDTLKNRISRLEKTVYGNEKTGDLTGRLNKLSNDLSADVMGLEIHPSEDTFREIEELKADTTVNYPIVDEIEQKIFGETYKNRDFHTRIVTIERKLFGKIYDIDDYTTRMDRIKTVAMPETLLTDKNRFEYDNNNTITSDSLSGLNSSRYGNIMPYGQRNLTRPYTNYGEYSGEKTPSDNLNNELSQLEYDTFGTEFSSDDTKTRIKRLNSVNKAKKSSRKYDSQKFQQHMATAMEIGAMILMILAMVL